MKSYEEVKKRDLAECTYLASRKEAGMVVVIAPP